jgi:leader peptidase (prepilin peptidase) / N-methyltransferase
VNFAWWPLIGLTVGAVAGFAADRLATRWPEHEEGVAARGLDWRTVVLTLAGALVLGGLFWRWTDPSALLVLVPFALALLVLMATDIDQRLLPDLITLPMIVAAAVVLVAGWSPMLAGKEFALVSGLAAGIGAPVFLFVTDFFLKGALGFGDLKLAVSIGLLSGISRLFVGFLLASVGFAAVLLVLIASRRLGLRTAIPFGPVLIGAAFVAMLLP